MRVGILLPSSRFYPYLGMDFIEGLKKSLPSEIDIIDEEINTASPSEIQKAARNLILRKNVNIITGWIGYKAITALIPLTQQTKTPLIMCNAGEQPLIKQDKNPFIIHCSLQLFESSFLISKWAFNTIGSNYSNLLSFYDGGYPFAYAAKIASDKYKGNVKCTEVYRIEDGSDIKVNLNKVFGEKNEFVFTSSSGYDAVELIKALKQDNQYQKTPIVSTSMLPEEQVLLQAGLENIYSINTWANNSNEIREHLNVYFKNTLYRDLSPFGILGNEAGLIIKQCLANGWKPKNEIEPFINKKALNSARGELKYNSEFNSYSANYSLFKTSKSSKEDIYENVFIENIIPEKHDSIIVHSFKEETSGWLNSYLCV